MKFTLIFSMLLLSNNLISQVKIDSCINSINFNCIDQLHEKVYLHLSRWSVVAGERLYFKAYIIKKDIVESKILYIEIIDSNNNLKAFSRSNIDSGICRSSIVIPDSLSTGIYSLIAYTNVMRNFPASSFLHSSLLIVGIKNKPVEIASSKINTEAIEERSSEDDTFDIKFSATLNKEVYGQNEKVILNLDLKNSDSKPLNGSFSISVFEKLPVNYSNLNCNISRIFTTDEACNIKYQEWLVQKQNKCISFPYKQENKSFLLEGVLIDKISGKPEIKKTIYLSSPDSLANLKYSVTDSSGNFIFALDRKYDNRKLFLNVNENYNFKEYLYKVDNKSLTNGISVCQKLTIDSVMNEYVLKCKKIASINKVYYKSNSVKTSILPINSNRFFYGRPDFSLRLSDYAELENFNEITANLIPDLVFRKKKDKYSVYIGNIVFQRFPDKNCLVLLNNVPCYNFEYLSALGSRQLDHVDVIYRNLIYGNIEFYGILAAFTKDKIVVSDRQTLVFENKVEYLSNAQTKNIDNIGSTQFPDFQQLLLWNPDLSFDYNGHATIEFYTSSLPAEYIVDIEGLTHSGIPVSKRIFFKVQ